MSKTQENLSNALAGEVQAHIRYLAFARRAAEEGFPGVDLLFRAAATSEKVHAQSHQCALQADAHVLERIQSAELVEAAIAELVAGGAVNDTRANLQTAVDGETHEFKIMYPAMIQDAAAEKMMDARHSLEYAMSIEMNHAKMFKKALAEPQKNDVEAYYVCPVCGHTVASAAPKKCPYCGVDASKFHKVD
jgi:rubrerythrin